MAANTKLKISNFAKDIGVKSKDLVEILKAKGIDENPLPLHLRVMR